MTKGEHACTIEVPKDGFDAVGGLCEYGVMQRGEGKPFMLAYYPKLVGGKLEAAKPWDKLPLEITSTGTDKFVVTFMGKPVPSAQVVVVTPTGEGKEPFNTDARGEFKFVADKAGQYGIRAKHFESKAGEHAGKKYEEVRHYATIVFTAGPVNAKATATSGASSFAPLPQAVSSFGAAAADGWVYVYGGHCSKTHSYSTDAVSGSFRRLNAADAQTWQDLPGGPKLQGLAMVSHKGKIYRIGGMQPRNAPGTPADNHSVKTVSVYDPAKGTWQNLPDMPTGRSSHDAVVADGKLYVFGGWQMNGKDAETDWATTGLVLDLDSKSPKWEAISQPFSRRALTAAVLNGKVYVIGGMNEEDHVELKVDIYDPATKSWKAGTPIPGPRRNGFSPAACVAGGHLFVSVADGKVHRLSDPGDAWQQTGELKQARIVHRMVAPSEEVIVTVGGASKGGNVALTEVIQAH
jgi:N-acetylneuraminic acid mutarotase